MTHREKIEAIRQKCIEANPEIVELKFGCRVYGNEANPFLEYIGKNKGQHALLIPATQALLFVNNVETKIIGRPIRLADVLNALMHTDHMACIASNERFEIFDKDKNEWIQQFKTWHFSQDDLTDQSEETIDFLWSLLTPNSSKERV